jgi:hypothetical protein
MKHRIDFKALESSKGQAAEKVPQEVLTCSATFHISERHLFTTANYATAWPYR